MGRDFPRELIFVSGLSGAGKSVALTALEDLGYFCIDNLPLPLVQQFDPTALADSDPRYARVAVLIDARAAEDDVARFPETFARMRRDHPDFDMCVLFFTASDEVILRRYSETRRKHPLSSGEQPLAEAIAHERELLEPITRVADFEFDTSEWNVHQLRERLQASLSPGKPGSSQVLFQSFGFKKGLPPNLDLVFDVRCLPNPHWEHELRPLTGYDAPVADWLGRQTEVQEMFEDIRDFLERWLPRYTEQDRNYVTIGIGCTGGRHRSVYLVERLCEHFKSRYPLVLKRHTELP